MRVRVTIHGNAQRGQVDVYVHDHHHGNPLWHGSFSPTPTREELAELAHASNQNGFDPKLVLLPLKKVGVMA